MADWDAKGTGFVVHEAHSRWMDWAKRSLAERKFPRRHRRAKWIAEAQFQRAVERLRTGDIAIDCGANLGHVTRALAERGATVYAFEPDPHAFVQLRSAMDGLSNVHLFEQAVGAGTGSAMLYRAQGFADNPDFHTQSSSLFADKSNVDRTAGIAVTQIDLVSFVNALPQRVALLKMDIEGAEVPVLEALLDTGVVDRIDLIFAETHENKIPALEARTRALRDRIAAGKHTNINLDWD